MSADDTRHCQVMRVERNKQLGLGRPGAPKFGGRALALKNVSDFKSELSVQGEVSQEVAPQI